MVSISPLSAALPPLCLIRSSPLQLRSATGRCTVGSSLSIEVPSVTQKVKSLCTTMRPSISRRSFRRQDTKVKAKVEKWESDSESDEESDDEADLCE